MQKLHENIWNKNLAKRSRYLNRAVNMKTIRNTKIFYINILIKQPTYGTSSTEPNHLRKYVSFIFKILHCITVFIHKYKSIIKMYIGSTITYFGATGTGYKCHWGVQD